MSIGDGIDIFINVIDVNYNNQTKEAHIDSLKETLKKCADKFADWVKDKIAKWVLKKLEKLLKPVIYDMSKIHTEPEDFFPIVMKLIPIGAFTFPFVIFNIISIKDDIVDKTFIPLLYSSMSLEHAWKVAPSTVQVAIIVTSLVEGLIAVIGFILISCSGAPATQGLIVVGLIALMTSIYDLALLWIY
jgi:hypothetical protein